MKKIFLVVLIFIVLQSSAQTLPQRLPDSDIYLVQLSQQNGAIKFDTVKLMAKWDEYDNQPSFSTSSDMIYYSSLRDHNLTDICIYFFNGDNDGPFIETGSSSEFSPMELPTGDGISLVRENLDGTLQIWKYTSNGDDPVCLTPDIKNAGFYCWLNNNQMIIRREGKNKTSRLELYNLDTKDTALISEAPGISLYKVPNENSVYFIDKTKPFHCLMKYNADTMKKDSLATVPNDIDDFAANVYGDVWIISNGKLLSWSPATPDKWNMIHELTGELKRGYRLAISRDMKWMAIVVKEKGK